MSGKFFNFDDLNICYQTSRIGFFGGSFDPPHIGHINLAMRAFESNQLDYIFFCPTNISPAKMQSPPEVSATHRFKMLELAIKNIPYFIPIDIEIHRSPPSFTVDSLRILRSLTHHKLAVILSEETAVTLPKWKKVDEIFEMADLIVGRRQGINILNEKDLPIKIQLKIVEGRCEIPMFDVSSREIRSRLKKGLFCGHMLPSKVLDYIYKYQLYLV